MRRPGIYTKFMGKPLGKMSTWKTEKESIKVHLTAIDYEVRSRWNWLRIVSYSGSGTHCIECSGSGCTVSFSRPSK
jgi:hypothetical protein